MAKERLFWTGSTSIIGDSRLTATELRVYAAVSLHDGMSLLKGKGAGCYASNQSLAARVDCDYSTLCKALSRLTSFGYLLRQTSADDRRMTVYRVAFPTESEWPTRHLTDVQIGGEFANNAPEIGGEDAKQTPKVGGEAFFETDANPPETPEHYIPLKGELDSVETEELNSSEEARFAARLLPKIEFADNDVAQMANLERALKAGKKVNCLAWSEWLSHVGECDDNALSNHAGRLADLVLEAMTDEEYAQWGRDHGWVGDDGKWDCAHPRGEAA